MAAFMSESGAGSEIESPVGRDCLQTKQLEQRAEKDINARSEDVHIQEAVAVRTVGSSKAVEKADELFEQQLEFSRYVFEFRNDKNSDQQCGKQKQPRHGKRRNQPGIDLHPKQIKFVAFVQHCISHYFLYGFVLRGTARQDHTGE